MILGYLDLLISDPLTFLRVFPVVALMVGGSLLIAITVHEFSHSLVAYLLGDQTSKRLGRLSLNPIRHMDPTGTVLLFLVGFGWGKPVPVNDRALRYGRQGMALVSGIGPVSNVITAVVFALPFRAGLLAWPFRLFSTSLGGWVEGILAQIFSVIILFNIILAVFNLLPIFPLDGSKVVQGLLPRDMARNFVRLERYGPVILMVIIGLDLIAGVGILRAIVGPMVNYVSQAIVGHTFF
jgi:Zn-dependent protease